MAELSPGGHHENLDRLYATSASPTRETDRDAIADHDESLRRRAEEVERALADELRRSSVWQNEYLGQLKKAELARDTAKQEHAAYRQHMVGEFAKQEARVKALQEDLATALKDRDEARRMYCEAEADAERRCWEQEETDPPRSPRLIAAAKWPSDADRLFPGGKVTT